MRNPNPLMFVLLPLIASPALARDYYVSNSGNDAASGASPAQALRTLARAGALALRPGDAILLKGGDTFAAPLVLDRADSGTSAQPTRVATYRVSPSDPRARILSAAGHGIEAHNVSGLRIEDLEVSGQTGAIKADGNGILLVSDQAGARPSDVTIADVVVSGFTGDHDEWRRTGDGIYIDIVGEGLGYRNVTVQDSTLFENDHSGLTSETETGARHENLVVQRVVARENRGLVDSAHYSGSGIVLSGVNGGAILDSKAYRNGERNQRDGGPVGIWAWNADSIRIAGCESYENHTNGGSDGGGFDFDGGVTNSIIEHNVSHDNDGAGYMLCTYSGADPVARNIVRDNVSVNDGQKNGYGALVVLGDINDSVYENNDVTVNLADKPLKAIWYWFWAGKNVVFRNNRIHVSGAGNLLTMTWWDESAVQGVAFEGNAVTYVPQGPASHAVRVEYGDPELEHKAKNYKRLEDWMSKAGQARAFVQAR
jgi:hypothetical protein